MIKKIFCAILPYIILLFGSCDRPDPILADEPLSFVKPAHFPEPLYRFGANPITRKGFELGKALFYDPALSRDNTISCGSCHQQSFAFTQHGHDLSHGTDGLLTLRNSQPIMNLAWKPLFFWDGGVFDLDLFAIAPIEAHNELNHTVSEILVKLNNSNKYPVMFEAAFGSRQINADRFLKALSQFQLMCISANSRFDKVMNKQANFEPNELLGKQIFDQKCASCHSGVFFTNNEFVNNGLPIGKSEDKGRENISWLETDRYKFGVPSLRNVMVSGPYMHDGRFRTIEKVLDFYDSQNSEMIDSPTLHPALRNAEGSLGIKLSQNEKINIISFLNTLTDHDFLTDKKLAEY